MELIDVTPQMLQQRMRDGKIYAREKVEQALGAFFTTGNLIALRELALREIADDVDERLEAWDRNQSLRGPLRRREVIFVGINIGSGAAERLIRRGFRIAYRLKADWHVHYVHSGGNPLSEELIGKRNALHALVSRMGGAFECTETPSHSGIAEALLAAADRVKATQIIVGQSSRPRWLLSRNMIKPLLRMGRHIDVLIAAER